VSKRLSVPLGTVTGLDQGKEPGQPGKGPTSRGAMVKAQWKRRSVVSKSSPKVDRLESVLTKFYLAGEGPEWQAIWDQVQAVLEQTTDTPVDRYQARLPWCSGASADSAAATDASRRFPRPGTPTRCPAAMSSGTRRIAINIVRLPELLGKGERELPPMGQIPHRATLARDFVCACVIWATLARRFWAIARVVCHSEQLTRRRVMSL
jgi:hypothetical protein